MHVTDYTSVGPFDTDSALTSPGWLCRTHALALATLCACALSGCAKADAPATGAWAVYGGNAAQQRYSALTQIDRTNVTRLAIAWTYDTGETGGFQVSPIVVDGVLYANTPSHKAIALDAATGVLKWKFDPGVDGRGPNRGVTYWRSGNEARVFAAVEQSLYALDAATGIPIRSFGTNGAIDLRRDLGRDPAMQSVRLTSPGIVYRDLIIVGGRVGEGDGASPGDVRAYDVRSGQLKWTFRTLPRAGEPGADSWPAGAVDALGGANNWAGMALDEARGIVYVPTGSVAPDFYGGARAGDNLFANSLVALEAATGQRLWHYQVVHHDIWDRDLPSPPTLLTVTRGSARIDAVAQTTKHGFVFVLNRETGEPLFPVVETPFPPSAVPGEVTAKTQPVPSTPAPFARQRLTADMLTSRTPEARAWAQAEFTKFRSEGQFVPFALDRDTVVFPGFDGGAEWGGSAVDPQSGVLFVNANDIAWTGGLAPAPTGESARALYLTKCAACHGDGLAGAPPQIPSLVGIGQKRPADQLTQVIRAGAGRMPANPDLTGEQVAALVAFLQAPPPAVPAVAPGGAHGGETAPPAAPPSSAPASRYRFTGYRKFLDPDGYPAVAPPWGTLNAIDLNTGEYRWSVPLGEYPELAARGVPTTGTENYGGPIVTASGLVFIGATSYDKKFRAFDAATGKVLWEAVLPFSGNATPATYAVGGRQFVVIPAGGGKARGAASGGVYVAFALPK